MQRVYHLSEIKIATNKKKNAIIEEAISKSNRANAKSRYAKLDEVKANFVKFFAQNKATYKSKSATARAFFESVPFNEKVLIAPTYDKDQHKDGLEKATRNLLKVIKE